MRRPVQRPQGRSRDDITTRAHARRGYCARLSDKLVGMLAAAEAMGGDMNDASLLHRLSIELTAIAATASSYGFESVALHAIEARRILIAGHRTDAACVHERIRGLISEFDKACNA